jgi:hypothetical protein
VSQRMTAMIGWGATTKFQEQWVFDQVRAPACFSPASCSLARRHVFPRACVSGGSIRESARVTGRYSWS